MRIIDWSSYVYSSERGGDSRRSLGFAASYGADRSGTDRGGRVMKHYEPSWRKPAGMFMILALILLWAVLVGSLSGLIGQLPMIAQVPVYIFLGLIWIWVLPLKRLLAWMETGRDRKSTRLNSSH